MSKQLVQPLSWPRPKGYAHGVVASGRFLCVAGQLGWDLRLAKPKLGKTFKEQFGQALANVLDVLRCAGGRPDDLIRLTVYIVNKVEYQAARGALGELWKARVGRHYPAITVVRVAGLLEPKAKVEIEATAVLDEPRKTSPAPTPRAPGNALPSVSRSRA
jgi:enamine deaminase RidA (YjgF/YER057c/UK114 family)